MPENKPMKKFHYINAKLKAEIADVLEPFKRRKEWEALCIPGHETPSAMILLEGKPGTGKTTLARHVLKEVSGLAMAEINMLYLGDVASKSFGDTEKAMGAAFNDAKRKATRPRKPGKCPVIFLDEVESIAMKRDLIVSTNTPMLSIVDKLLIEIDSFMEAGGVIVAATNHGELLDGAFVRRLTNRITLEPPTGEDAIKIWENLLPPEPFGCFPPLDAGARGWTPNEIEKAIMKEVRRAFRAKENMKQENL